WSDPLQRPPARYSHPAGRQAGRARGALARWALVGVPRDPRSRRSRRAVRLRLSLPTPRSDALRVPRALRSRGRLSIRSRDLERGAGVRAMSATELAPVVPLNSFLVRDCFSESASSLSRREAAELSGTTLGAVNKAIEQKVLQVQRCGARTL